MKFKEGKFVWIENGLNYQEVLDEFPKAKIVRVMTFNISKNERSNQLLDEISKLPEDIDIQFITNIPSHFDRYYNSPRGDAMRRSFRENCEVYLRKLNPDNFPPQAMTFFNFSNHAKIVGTENVVYIGSANFSNESQDNIETGVIIRDKVFIKSLYNEFFDRISEQSLPYFDDEYMALRVFVMSMLTKFRVHFMNFSEEMYWENPYTNNIEFVRRETWLSENQLNNLNYDLYLLEDLVGNIENAYEEEDYEYNDQMQRILELYNFLDLARLQELTEADGILYNFIKFDMEAVINSCLEEYYAEAYDEYLDHYVEVATDDAREIEENMLDEVEEVANEFYTELKKVLDSLEEIADIVSCIGEQRINSQIDNT